MAEGARLCNCSHARTPAGILLGKLRFAQHIRSCGERQGGRGDILLAVAQNPCCSKMHHHLTRCSLGAGTMVQVSHPCLGTRHRQHRFVPTYVLMDAMITARRRHPFAKHMLQRACAIASSEVLCSLLERYIWFLLGVVTKREVRCSQQIPMLLSYAQIMSVHSERDGCLQAHVGLKLLLPETTVDRLGVPRGSGEGCPCTTAGIISVLGLPMEEG